MRAKIKEGRGALHLEAKKARKKKALRLFIAIAIIVLCIWVVLSYPQTGILIFVAIIGGIYVLDAINILYQPLKSEFYAFQKIVEAIEILEESKEDIFYEEAFRCINKAYKILKSIELKEEFGLYDWSNEVFRAFLDNLKLIVLPAITEGSIISEHLEDIALAIYETDPILLNSVNGKIEGEKSYPKGEAGERKIVSFAKKFQENQYGKILISLGFGFGLVLIISLIYVMATQQDFIVFARGNPETIILGGLGISGIAVWKRKIV